MTSSDGGVVVVHPGKQHAYEVALALQGAGLLREFVTGIYYKPATFPYSFISWLPPSLRAGVLRQLGKRTEPALTPELVRSWPYAEIFSRTVGHTRWIYQVTRGRSGFPFANWVSDLYTSRLIANMRPRPAMVYGFLGGVLRTFAHARELKIPTVLDVPIVFDGHETLRREYVSLGLSEAMMPPTAPFERLRKELELADWVVTPSPAVADSVRRAGFLGRGIFIVPFGADTSVFKPAVRRADPTRFRVVFAGRLEVRKGLHYALEAWRDAGLDGEFIVAGPPGEEEFVARLRQQYKGAFVEAGNLTRSKLAELFSTSDVFVLPSLAEGSALVTYQALASGLPCIVTAETGSVVRDGVEGFVIAARDSRALRNRLETLCRDRDLRHRMAGAARARSQEFTWHRYHRELTSVIDRVLERERPSTTIPVGETYLGLTRI